MHRLLPTILSLIILSLPVLAEQSQEQSKDGWSETKIPTVEEPSKKKYGRNEQWLMHRDWSNYYVSKGQLQLAEDQANMAIEQAKEAGKEDDVAVGSLYGTLGSLYRAKGHFDQAVQAFKQATDILSRKSKDQVEVAMMQNNEGEAYTANGQPDKALPVLLEAKSKLTDQQAIYGLLMQNLGMAYAKLNQDAEAEDAFKKGIEVDLSERFHDPNTAVESMFGLSLLYAKQKRIADISTLLEKAIPLAEKTFGDSDPRTKKLQDLKLALPHTENIEAGWTSSMNAGKTAFDKGDLAESEKLYASAVKQAEAFGAEDNHVAASLSMLGVTYLHENKFAEAEPLFKRSLQISEKTMGPSHPSSLANLDALAEIYKREHKYAEAEPLCKRAFELREEAIGSNNQDTIVSLRRLIALYDAEGKSNEAETLSKQSLETQEKTLGPDHPNVSEALNDRGMRYLAKGNYAEAEPLFKRALAIMEKAALPNDQRLATSLNNLASLDFKQGKYKEAEPLFKRAIAITEKSQPVNNQRLVSSLCNLSEVFKAEGRYVEAEQLYKRAIAMEENDPSTTKLALSSHLRSYADLLRKTGRQNEATTMETRANSIQPMQTLSLASITDSDWGKNMQAGIAAAKKGQYALAAQLYSHSIDEAQKFGANDPRLAISLGNLGAVYDKQGKYSAAEGLLTRSLAISQTVFGANSMNLTPTLETLAVVYCQQKRFLQAVPLLKRVATIREQSLGATSPAVIASKKNYAALLRVVNQQKAASKLPQLQLVPLNQ